MEPAFFDDADTDEFVARAQHVLPILAPASFDENVVVGAMYRLAPRLVAAAEPGQVE
jgi:hypothetical protein